MGHSEDHCEADPQDLFTVHNNSAWRPCGEADALLHATFMRPRLYAETFHAESLRSILTQWYIIYHFRTNNLFVENVEMRTHSCDALWTSMFYFKALFIEIDSTECFVSYHDSLSNNFADLHSLAPHVDSKW